MIFLTGNDFLDLVLKSFQTNKLRSNWLKMVGATFYVTVEVLIGVLALIGNIFVITLFLYDPRLKINRNFYLISLAFANILVGGLEIPLTIFVSTQNFII